MSWRPVVLMLIGAVTISTSAPWVKLAQVDPSVSGFYRVLFGAMGLLVIGLVQRRRFWLGWRYASMVFLAAAFFALDLYFWHHSIHYVGPGLATILGNFQVFILAVIGWSVFGERIRAPFVIGLLCAFAGVWLLVGVDWSGLGEQYQWGVILGLLTAVAYSLFILAMRRLQSVPGTLSPIANLTLMSLMCAAIMAAVVSFEGGSLRIPDRQSFGALLAYGLMCQALGWVLITKAMPSLNASLVGVILLLQPALSFVWDVVFFDRPTDGWDQLGAVMVLLGIYLASRKSRDSNPENA